MSAVVARNIGGFFTVNDFFGMEEILLTLPTEASFMMVCNTYVRFNVIML